jgi:mycothiol synthase
VRNERRDDAGQLLSLESEPATEADAAEARAAGLSLVRCNQQLRVALPLADSTPPLPTRAFALGADDDAFLRVNNLAFAWHPDQSDQTHDQLNELVQEPWFDAEGFLLHEIDGTLAGFCWTRVHAETATDPQLGEIFVIAVDPSFHGQGLGRSLTIAGLAFLASKSIEIGMLHVEHDNVAAQCLYRDLGFVEHDSRCWWELVESEPT